MKKRTFLILSAVLASVLTLSTTLVWSSLASSGPVAPEAPPAAPDVFASPINGGCYIAAPGDCRIHIDPLTIIIAPGQKLVRFTFFANGSPIYDFRTDVSNPPGSNYSPSLVMQDFAATCGETYTINMTAQDSGDPNPLNAGQIENVVCPSVVP